MSRRSVLALLVALATWVPGSRAVARNTLELPGVARPVIEAGRETVKPGTVFFLPVGDQAVAVGAAHSFDVAQLARGGEVRFQLGRSERQVSVSSRFLVEPGRAFRETGGSLLTDYVVFALDLPPRHVRVLQPDPQPPRPGSRVRILGVPATIPQDEDDIFGKVAQVTAGRIEVDLDVPFDLRGWGGAPVLDYESGAVIGMLQAALPREHGLAVAVSPIATVVDALERPLEGGRGLPFSSFVSRDLRDLERAASRAAAEPAGTPAVASTTRGPSEAPRPAPSSERVGSDKAGRNREAAGSPAPPPKRLLSSAPEEATQVVVEIEHPYDGALIGSDTGAFVAGRAVALRGEPKRFDVVLVLDTSGSTKEMSGADINGNGIVGEDRLGGLFFGSTDPGDSILAAEVAAAKQLLKGLDARSTRVGVVTFAGDQETAGAGPFVFGSRGRPAAMTEEPLTREYARIERALDRVLERGAQGMTHMAAGVDQATIELLGLKQALSEKDPESEKIALFLTDGQPTLPYDPMMEAANTRAVFRAADRAHKAGVRIHSFAIGPDALDGPVAAVEMAARTHGYFTPVRHPGNLVDLIEEVNFANLKEVEVRNETNGVKASLVQTQPDGAWSALVPLVAGKNQIRVTARASDGAEASDTVVVQHAPGSPDPALPGELLPRRTALLERRLIDLQRGRLEVEREAAEATRKELLLEIEREREAAQERAEQQRKELELEAQRESDAP